MPNFSDSCMVAIYPSSEAAAKVAQLPGDTPEDELHVTLAYLGKLEDLDAPTKAKLVQAVVAAANEASPLKARISGIGRFKGGDTDPLYLGIDCLGLDYFRADLARSISKFLPLPEEHGFTPHMTLSYLETDAPTPALDLDETSWEVASVALVLGTHRIDVPFGR